MRASTAIVLITAALAVLGACAPQEPAPTPEPEPEPAPEVAVAVEEPETMTAVAILEPRAEGQAGGSVTFRQEGYEVMVVAEVSGVAPGLHGIHLHEVGDCSAEDFTSAGGHFNPTGAPHGGPEDAERHAGDFGNIEAGDDGSGRLELVTGMLTVAEGPNSVVGRAVILHESEDDLVSQPTGAAGGRVACGVVALEGEAMAEDETPEGEGASGDVQ